VVAPSAPDAFDTYARIMAPRLSELLGAPVVIDNRPGANGNIGMAEVQRSPSRGGAVNANSADSSSR
jgi:tripartite-type tricarboxylate transporter receptor subunit TctC